MRSFQRAAVLGALLLVVASGMAAADVLVYDNNSNNQYAQMAAAGLSGPVTVADSAGFNAALTSQPWDIVLVDCPSSIPVGGWTDLINFINAGGRVVMSFWDWDNDSGQGDPGLSTAFGFTTATSFMLTDGVDVLDAAATEAGAAVFAGVPDVPHSSWFDNWFDDGDAYTFTGSEAIAELNGNPDPVTIVNESCTAIATFAVDEWAGAGGVEFWQGMANYLLGGCTPPAPIIEIPTLSGVGLGLLVALLSGGGIVLLRRRRR